MNEREYQVGDRVQHPEFGEGLVLETKGRGEGAVVVVSFKDKSQRKLVVRLAKLSLLQAPEARERGA